MVWLLLRDWEAGFEFFKIYKGDSCKSIILDKCQLEKKRWVSYNINTNSDLRLKNETYVSNVIKYTQDFKVIISSLSGAGHSASSKKRGKNII